MLDLLILLLGGGTPTPPAVTGATALTGTVTTSARYTGTITTNPV